MEFDDDDMPLKQYLLEHARRTGDPSPFDTLQELAAAMRNDEYPVPKLNIKPGVLGEDILQQINKIGELK
jgi:hypothetical protein